MKFVFDLVFIIMNQQIQKMEKQTPFSQLTCIYLQIKTINTLCPSAPFGYLNLSYFSSCSSFPWVALALFGAYVFLHLNNLLVSNAIIYHSFLTNLLYYIVFYLYREALKELIYLMACKRSYVWVLQDPYLWFLSGKKKWRKKMMMAL